MRTTVTLDDDVAAAIEGERARTGESFRSALNRLVRRGLRSSAAVEGPPLPVFEGAPIRDITDVSAALADLDEEGRQGGGCGALA